MSYMKQYAADTADFELRAMETAWIVDPASRAQALKALFEDCGTAATVYHEPAGVAALFVHSVAETYTTEFLVQGKQAA